MYSFQWTLTDLACEMFSMVTVPVYDTHGPQDCIYIINHGRGRRISPSILISRHLSPSVTIYEYARLLSVTTLNSVSLSQAPRHLCAMMVIISTKNPPALFSHFLFFLPQSRITTILKPGTGYPTSQTYTNPGQRRLRSSICIFVLILRSRRQTDSTNYRKCVSNLPSN